MTALKGPNGDGCVGAAETALEGPDGYGCVGAAEMALEGQDGYGCVGAAEMALEGQDGYGSVGAAESALEGPDIVSLRQSISGGVRSEDQESPSPPNLRTPAGFNSNQIGTAGLHEVSLEGLPSGPYILTFYTDDGRTTPKKILLK